MLRRHHRNPRTLQEFIDATVDHLEDYWTELENHQAVTKRFGAPPAYLLDRRGKLAGKPSGQLVNDSERTPGKAFKFRLRLEVVSE